MATPATAPEALNATLNSVRESIKDHNSWLDPILYNWITILAILSGTAATILAALKMYPVRTAVCSGAATALVAIAAHLDFGQRWQFHRNLRFEFRLIEDRINAIPLIRDTEQAAYIAKILDDLASLRKEEAKIPGITAVTTK